MLSILKLRSKFSKKRKLFTKMEYLFLVESTTVGKAIFPYKTAVSRVNVKSNKMGSTKWTEFCHYFIF